MKLLYTPFSIAAKTIGHRVGQSAFTALWAKLGETEKPSSPTDGRHSLVQVAGTAALEAATQAGIGAAIDQLSARVFHHLFGAWPDKPKDD